MKVLFVLLGLELAALLGEVALVAQIGQEPIAAAMLTAPTSTTALLGVAAVLARVAGRALLPAAAAFVLVATWSAPRRGERHTAD